MRLRRLPKPASFNRIYARILSNWFLEASNTCTVIAFTSRSHHEGVSTVVAGLARAFGTADPGRVLVLDVAPGQRRVAELLNVQVLVEFDAFEAGYENLPGYVTRDETLGIDILTLANTGQTGPAEVQRAQLMLDRLRSYYRVILVDAGVLTNGGGVYWLACSNYRVLVIDTTVATREILEHQRKEIEHSGITLDGSILNKRTYPIPGFLYWLAR